MIKIYTTILFFIFNFIFSQTSLNNQEVKKYYFEIKDLKFKPELIKTKSGLLSLRVEQNINLNNVFLINILSFFQQFCLFEFSIFCNFTNFYNSLQNHDNSWLNTIVLSYRKQK